MSTPAAPLTLRPSPLDLGGVFNNTFQIYKRRFGLFVLLAVLPAAVALVASLVTTAVALALLLPLVTKPDFNPADLGGLIGLIALVVLSTFLATLLVVLAQIKAQAMMSLATQQIAVGEASTFTGLWRETGGVVLRVLGVVLAACLAIFVVLGLIFGYFIYVMIQSFASLSSGGTPDAALGGQMAAAVSILFIGELAFMVAVIFLVIRFFYFVPVLAIEKLGAVEALKRSWNLTKGNFWRTFGYYLVVAIAVGVVTSAAAYIAEMPLLGLASQDNTDSAAITAAMIPFTVMLSLFTTAIQLVSGPFLEIYLTVMYLDQVQRTDFGIVPARYPMAYAGNPNTNPYQTPQYPNSQYPNAQYPNQAPSPQQGYPLQGSQQQGQQAGWGQQQNWQQPQPPQQPGQGGQSNWQQGWDQQQGWQNGQNPPAN